MSTTEQEAGQRTNVGTVSFTTTADEVVRVLHNGMLSASRDTGRPTLCCLKFEYGFGELKVISTDSYRLGIDTLDMRENLSDEAPGSVLLDRDDADAIIKMLKAFLKKYRFSVPIKVSIGERVVVAIDHTDGQTYSARPMEGDFPNWERLLPGANTSRLSPTESIGFNPRFLADYAKLLPAEPNTPLRFTFCGPGKPALIEYGRTYKAMLMPIRLPK